MIIQFHRYRLLVVICILTILGACQPKPTEIGSKDVVVAPTPTLTPSPTPINEYDFENFVYAQKYINAKERKIKLTNLPQLLVDDYLFSEMDNITAKIQTPEKHPANPLLVQEYPWEKRVIQMYGSVIYEPEQDKFRMWYMASEDENMKPEWYMCYAESKDGIHWEKPMIGTAKHPKYKEHNIVLMDGHGVCVIKDEDEADPEKRYKGLGGNITAYSADGIHWATQAFMPNQENDTSSSLVKWGDSYLAYIRHRAFVGDNIRHFIREQYFRAIGVRELAVTKSQDFQIWLPKTTIISSLVDYERYPYVQPYGMSVAPFGDLLLGLTWFIDLDRQPENYTQGTLFTKLSVSRNGINWNWVDDGKQYFSSEKNAWDSGRIFPGSQMFQKGNRIWIYYTGSDVPFGEGNFGHSGIGLATLPADRFVGFEPRDDNEPASLTTYPICFDAQDLLVNAQLEDPSSFQLEIRDATTGTIIPGFEGEYTVLEPQDDLRYRVRWKNGDDNRSILDLPSNAYVVFQFHWNHGSLFAFQVTPVDDKKSILKPHPRSEFAALQDGSMIDKNDLMKRGEIAFRSGQYDNTIQYLTALLQLAPEYTLAYGMRGLVFARIKDYELAVKDCNTAIRISPNEAMPHYFRGLVYFLKGDHEKAIEDFSHAIEINPSSPMFYGDRGMAYIQTQKYDAAIADFNKVIELNPDDIYVYTDRGNLLFAARQYQDAIRDYDRAIQLSANNIHAIRNRGMSYLFVNQYAKAIQDLSVVEDVAPITAYYNIARAYALLAQESIDESQKESLKQSAIEFLGKAIDAGLENLQFIRGDEALQSIHGHPDLEALLKSKTKDEG